MVKAKTTKILKENAGKNLYNLEWGKDFLTRMSKAQTIKDKLDKFDH
jgi:hypothetical protein